MAIARVAKKFLASPLAHNTLGPVVRRPGVQVLMYHRIGQLDAEFDGLDIEVFREHVQWLSQHCTLITSAQLDEPSNFNRTRKPAVLLTFDDGYRDFLVNAYPILSEYNAPALVFLPTEAIQDGDTIWPERLNCWIARAQSQGAYTAMMSALQPAHATALSTEKGSKTDALKALPNEVRLELLADVESQLNSLGIDTHIERQMMTWDEIASTRPLVEYGAHTHTHPIVSRMSSTVFADDMQTCCALLESGLGARPRTFAWPNGRREDFSPDALSTLESLGFNQIFTTIEGVNNRHYDPKSIQRLPTTTPNVAALNALMLRAR